MTQCKASITKLCSDRGGEYLSGPFDNHLSKAGTLWILTIHDTPEYNGVSERLNRTLLEKVWAMLHASQLPKFLWGEAMKHAGAVPESLRKPRSCGMQATTWYGIGNLQATELQTTRTMPNNTKQAIQPPTLPQVPTSFKATPSSPTKTWNGQRTVRGMKMVK